MASNGKELTTYSITVPESEAEKIISDTSYAQEWVLKVKQWAANGGVENLYIEDGNQTPAIITLPAGEAITVQSEINAEGSVMVPVESVAIPVDPVTDASLVYKKREKIFNWTHRLTTMLINLRLEMEQDFKFPTTCKKADLWDKIAFEMQKTTSSAYGLTGMICDSKWRNLLTTYRKLRETYKTKKERRRNWEYFDQLEEAYGEELDNPTDKSDILASQQQTNTQISSSGSTNGTSNPAKRQKTCETLPPEWFLAYRREERFSEEKRRKEEKERLDRLEKIEQQKITVLNEFNSLLRILIDKQK
uniref:Myb/SANT-like DNA-binding domain-containing protein n=1 Tax=Strigamia maritima TaxID=126957 RepID=T1IU52_STRMM